MADPVISDPLIWMDNEAERTIIGKILSAKTYSRTAIERILQKAWNLQSGFDVIEVTGNAFLFKFVEEEEYNRILRGRPWSINGCLLNLVERSKYKAYEDFDFSHCPVWIQIHNIPLEAMCLENVVMIGGYVGEVLLAEDPHLHGRLFQNFLRARILLDLRKALAYGFWMNKPDGGRIWITVLYEKLQNFCFNCGKLGHDNRSCRSVKAMSAANSTEPCFGPWTTTSQCRTRDEAIVVVRNEWVEATYFRRRKEEAMMRRKKEQRSVEGCDPKLEEENLFFIKLNTSSGSWRDWEASSIGDERSPCGEDGDAEAKSPIEDHVDRDLCFSTTPQGPSIAVKEVMGGKVQYPGVAINLPPLSDFGSDLPNTSKALSPEIEGKASLSMVPYCGGSLKEVTNSLCGLGLKRGAEESFDLPSLKKRKTGVVGEDPVGAAISTYAGVLRKGKARQRNCTR
ncbi:hypothetical protein K1719_010236 [Acacia pycnantha]|nr:hypothetical protein K1719_010236 [Acacia pycnantha]